MTFYISYCIEYNRILPAIILEGRQSIAATKDKTGFEVKAYFDAEIAKVVDGVLPYKMETETGNLACYFSLKQVGAGIEQYQLFVRPNFLAFNSDIILKISTFINEGLFEKDILQGQLK